MHVLTVIAKDLSPEHLLAAIKHWVAKFEQEIMHKDMGPSDRGSYEFEHDGVPTEVHWNPASTVNHMQPVGAPPAGTPLTDEELEKVRQSGPNVGNPLLDGPAPDAGGAVAPTEPAPPPEAAAAFALAASMDPEKPTPAEPTEAAEHAAAQPDSTAADAHAAVAPDAA